MNIAVENTDPWTVFRLGGPLDAEGGPGVYLRFQRELSRGSSQFLFDLEQVDLVDSAGLGVLVRCYRDARIRGGMVCLQRVPVSIERILEYTRLNTIFPITDEFEAEDTRSEPRVA
jgi:stage II sporulation protein AA (anti-sigma F factor antagonist)